MENTKPQWLIDAENEINIAANTKYGMMTNKQFRASDTASYASSFVSDITRSKAGKIGGAKTAKSFTSESQKIANSKRSKKGIIKAITSAAAASAIVKKENTFKTKVKFYNLILEEEFIIDDLTKYLIHFPEFKDNQMFKIFLRDKEMYQIIGLFNNNKRGAKPKIYKKIWNHVN